MRFFRKGGAPTLQWPLKHHRNYFQLGFKVHPSSPSSRGTFFSLLPFAVRHINGHVSQQTTAVMDWCRVVGPCPPLDEKRGVPTNNPPHPTSVNTCKHLSWQGKSPSKAGRWQRQAFLLGSETGSPVRTGPAGPESLALEARAIKPWNLPAFGPRPSWGCAYRPRKNTSTPFRQ